MAEGADWLSYLDSRYREPTLASIVRYIRGDEEWNAPIKDSLPELLEPVEDFGSVIRRLHGLLIGEVSGLFGRVSDEFHGVVRKWRKFPIEFRIAKFLRDFSERSTITTLSEEALKAVVKRELRELQPLFRKVVEEACQVAGACRKFWTNDWSQLARRLAGYLSIEKFATTVTSSKVAREFQREGLKFAPSRMTIGEAPIQQYFCDTINISLNIELDSQSVQYLKLLGRAELDSRFVGSFSDDIRKDPDRASKTLVRYFCSKVPDIQGSRIACDLIQRCFQVLFPKDLKTGYETCEEILNFGFRQHGIAELEVFRRVVSNGFACAPRVEFRKGATLIAELDLVIAKKDEIGVLEVTLGGQSEIEERLEKLRRINEMLEERIKVTSYVITHSRIEVGQRNVVPITQLDELLSRFDV